MTTQDLLDRAQSIIDEIRSDAITPERLGELVRDMITIAAKGDSDIQDLFASMIYNVSQATDNYAHTQTTARSAVPTTRRKKGSILSYKTPTGDVLEMFTGSDLSLWINENSWTAFGTKADVKRLEEKAVQLEQEVNEYKINYTSLNIVAKQGYYKATNGVFESTNPEWRTIETSIVDLTKKYYATGSARPALTALALYFDNTGSLIGTQDVGSGTLMYYTRELLVLPSRCSKIAVTSIVPDISTDVYDIDLEVGEIIKSAKFIDKSEVLLDYPTTKPIGGIISANSQYDKDKHLQDSIDSIGNSIYSEVFIIAITPSKINIGYALKADGGLTSNAGYNTSEFNIKSYAGKSVAVSGRSPASDYNALAAVYDANGSFIKNYMSNLGQDIVKAIIDIPINAVTLKVMHYPKDTDIAYSPSLEEKFYTKSESNRLMPATYWSGKTIWWCGTSIPAGSDATLGSGETIAGNYPTQVGDNLRCSVVNKAVGGSMCRANTRTGDYNGANFANITSCLSMTNEEVEYFISNYSTIRGKLTGNPPTQLSQGDINRLRSASFETKLIPYLNGTYDMPDLFVIDHGHNDFKYTNADGSYDITLEPTITNISAGKLASDAFMTANNNAKLASFFGSLDYIPSSNKEDFIASVNRNCYIGAVNFIITLILSKNPRARILLVSNYEKSNGIYPEYAPLIKAQESLAEQWAFPLCEVYKCLSYSNKYIPNSRKIGNTANDIQLFKVYNPDGVHPHSDTTGIANKIYAGVLSEFIARIR